MKLKILLALILLLFFLPAGRLYAQGAKTQEDIFKAEVVEILESNKQVRDDGSVSIQQKIKLQGLEGKWKDKEIIFDGTEIDVLSANEYKIGDKVLVNYSLGPEGEV